MKRYAYSHMLIIALLSRLAIGPVSAQEPPGSQPAPTSPAAAAAVHAGARTSVTEHQITIGGHILEYVATAGLQQVKDGGGALLADMFYVAYTMSGVQDESGRPITFVFNGGPGSSSIWLHLGAVGPKRVRLAEDGGAPGATPRWVDNEFTWLPFTDLVVIDAVGTGFSRAAPGVPATRFYEVKEDAWSFAEFIRLYLTAHDRSLSPKFVAGESYGGTRAAILVRLLQDDFGVTLNGLILVSPVLNFETLNTQSNDPNRSTDLAAALDVPSYAATAWYYKKLAPDLQTNLQALLREVEQWSIDEYLPALLHGDALPQDEQIRTARALSRYTGIAEAVIRASHLRLMPNDFRRELLRDRQLEVGLMDGRMAFDPHRRAGSTGETRRAFLTVFNDYARTELKYQADRPYEVVSGRIEEAWNWGPGGLAGFLNVTDDLRQALRRNNSMRILVARGYYDLDVPYFGTEYALNQLRLGPRQANLTRTYYESGHMVYTSGPMREKLESDVSVFVKDALAGRE
jgi:carboxypeptidase C (cathepsin A)